METDTEKVYGQINMGAKFKVQKAVGTNKEYKLQFVVQTTTGNSCEFYPKIIIEKESAGSYLTLFMCVNDVHTQSKFRLRRDAAPKFGEWSALLLTQTYHKQDDLYDVKIYLNGARVIEYENKGEAVFDGPYTHSMKSLQGTIRFSDYHYVTASNDKALKKCAVKYADEKSTKGGESNWEAARDVPPAVEPKHCEVFEQDQVKHGNEEGKNIGYTTAVMSQFRLSFDLHINTNAAGNTNPLMKVTQKNRDYTKLPVVKFEGGNLIVSSVFATHNSIPTSDLTNNKWHHIDIIQEYQGNNGDYYLKVFLDQAMKGQPKRISSRDIDSDFVGPFKDGPYEFTIYKADAVGSFDVKNFRFTTAPETVNIHSCLYRPYYTVFYGRTVNSKDIGELRSAALSDCQIKCDKLDDCSAIAFKKKAGSMKNRYDCFFRHVKYDTTWTDDSTFDTYIKEGVNIKISDRYQTNFDTCNENSAGNNANACGNGWCCSRSDKADNGDCPAGVVNFLNYKSSFMGQVDKEDKICAAKCPKKGKCGMGATWVYNANNAFRDAHRTLASKNIHTCSFKAKNQKKTRKECRKIKNKLVKSKCIQYDTRVRFGKLSNFMMSLVNNELVDKMALNLPKSKKCQNEPPVVNARTYNDKDEMISYLKCYKMKKCAKKIEKVIKQGVTFEEIRQVLTDAFDLNDLVTV